MTTNQAIDELRVLLKGIDETESDSEYGWWETSAGAKFGARKFAQVAALIRTVSK